MRTLKASQHKLHVCTKRPRQSMATWQHFSMVVNAGGNHQSFLDTKHLSGLAHPAEKGQVPGSVEEGAWINTQLVDVSRAISTQEFCFSVSDEPVCCHCCFKKQDSSAVKSTGSKPLSGLTAQICHELAGIWATHLSSLLFPNRDRCSSTYNGVTS